MTKPERIAVTGVGLVSALGPDANTSFRELCAGSRGFAPVILFDVSDQRAQMAAQVQGLRVSDVAPPGEVEAWSRSDALAVLAARDAIESAGLDGPPADLSVCVGGSTGGMYEAETVFSSLREGANADSSARRLLAYPLCTTAERLVWSLGSPARAVTICSACSSGAVAIVQAAAWLLSGRAGCVLAGGTDGLCRLTFTGFNSLGAMDKVPCRPFDVNRRGLSLGEGASFLMLELESRARARGARVLAWLSGWGIGAEAHHITNPEPSGATASRVIVAALRRARLAPAEIDYVNAHGTGTLHNDAMEARALAVALGERVGQALVSSSKGQVGHTLAAAGAIEAAFTVLALQAGRVPPTGGLETPDPALALQHVKESVARPLRAALSNSFGFGGTGCVLVFEHSNAESRADSRVAPKHFVVTGLASLGPLGALEGEDNARYASAAHAFARRVPCADPLTLLDPTRSRRFDKAAALVALGAERALGNAGLAPALAGLVSGTAYGNVDRSVDFLKRVAERGPRLANPAEFPHLVPSAPSGNASIYLGIKGPVLSVSDLATSAEAAVEVAMGLVALELAEAVVAGSAEPFDPIVARVLAPLHGKNSAAARGEGAAFLVIESEQAAHARGARIFCTFSAWVLRWGSPAQAFSELPPPSEPGRAHVLLGSDDPALVFALEESAWARVERSTVLDATERHEGTGGFALCAGAALIATSQLGCVLVCGSTRGRTCLALLKPAAGAHDQ